MFPCAISLVWPLIAFYLRHGVPHRLTAELSVETVASTMWNSTGTCIVQLRSLDDDNKDGANDECDQSVLASCQIL